MKAILYDAFGEIPTFTSVQDPVPSESGVVIRVAATGVCRSDWLGWKGFDADIKLPHVPGHELAGTIEAVGKKVSGWKIGDRVTVPFVCGCGTCGPCKEGNQQICDHQFQPGFTHWGSFAAYVAIDYADVNLVGLPESMAFETAASLGCRFATSFRAIHAQGKVSGGQWVSIFGCGGVGLSAVMIASALGARVIAVDITDDKLELARSLGADLVVNARTTHDPAGKIRDLSDGGVHVSVDALGSAKTCRQSIASLRKHGKHVQIGLMSPDEHSEPFPIDLIVARELEVVGSHGMQAYRYPDIFSMIAAGKLQPEKLIGSRIALRDAGRALVDMGRFSSSGITIVTQF